MKSWTVKLKFKVKKLKLKEVEVRESNVAIVCNWKQNINQWTAIIVSMFSSWFQVQRQGSMRVVFKRLWNEEKFQMFAKGLSARLVQSASASFSIILGIETIKRFAINEEYKHLVRWWTLGEFVFILE